MAQRQRELAIAVEKSLPPVALLRDQFAMAALPVIIEKSDTLPITCQSDHRRAVAETAYRYADAMLAARGKA